MGKKINQNFKRIGFFKTWSNVWFTLKDRERIQFIREDIIINREIQNFFDLSSGVFEVNILRTNFNSLFINIWTGSSLNTIGKKHENINKIIVILKKKLPNYLKFKINIKNLYYSSKYYNFKTKQLHRMPAQFLSNKLGHDLYNQERFRTVMRRGIYLAKKVGCKGFKIAISGKLNGHRIARTETEKFGSMPLSTINKDIDYGKTLVNSKFGVMCIKIYIYNN